MRDEVAQTNQDTYDSIASQYADVRGETPWNSDLLGRFVSVLTPGSVVLDLGCGPGVESEYFLRKGFFVVATDLSHEMLKIAQERAGPTTIQANWLNLPFADESIDGLWSSATLLHIPHDSTSQAVREIARVLKPRGRLALITAAGSRTELEPVSYAEDEARWYFYRNMTDLTAVLQSHGFQVDETNMSEESRVWLEVFASRT